MKALSIFYILVSTYIATVSASAPTPSDNDTRSSVVVLSDSNFEKLTQATTGATTGPWFVKFYAPWCSHCRKMGPAWEKLAKDLKGRVNVADVDVTKNANLGGDRTCERLTAFVTGGFKSAKSGDIPKPLSLLGYLSEFVVSGVHESQRIYDAAFRGFFTIATFSFLFGVVIGMIFSVVLLTRNTAAHKTRITERKKD